MRNWQSQAKGGVNRTGSRPDLVATGSMGGEPHNPLKVPIKFSDIRANRFEYQS